MTHIKHDHPVRVAQTPAPAAKPVARPVGAPARAAQTDRFADVTAPATAPLTAPVMPAAPSAAHGVVPAWMGGTSVTITRESSEQPKLAESFAFDTWARQRAGTTRFSFEVWAPGVTDRENPDLWRQLEVEVHYRYGAQGAYKTDYVNNDARSGNNARYSLELRKYDPWSQDNVSTLNARAGIPVAEVKDATGHVISHEAKLEYYFTVNGKELRASNGKDFEGKFENY